MSRGILLQETTTQANTKTSSSMYETSTVARAYSFALQSVHDTKDNLIFVCIAILEALDRLQERFHLPTSVIKDIRKRLTKMIDRSIVRPVSLSTKENLQKVESLGEQVAESDVWGEIARPEEVKGVIMWLISMTKTLNAFMITTSLGLCRRVFVFIRNLPGVSLACTIFCRIYQMVEEVLSSFSKNGDNSLTRNTKNTMSLSKDHHVIQGHHHHHHDYSLGGIGIGDGGGAAAGSNSNSSIHAGYVTDPSLTAVVLEYREKECVVPWNINRRIQRVMHFQIPLRSFEATVRLPSPEHHEEEYQMFGTTTTTTGGEGICSSSSTSSSRKRQETTTTSSSSSLRPPPPHVVYTSASPRSIPVSPLARKRVQLAFSNFSDDILFQARDRLRQERIATLTGEQHLQIPRFNVQDCHEEIYLSCGRHCATKVGTGMYRSVRSTVSIETKRFVYFEMALKDLTQQKLKNKTTTNSIQEKQSTSFSVGTFKQFTTSSEVTSIETSSACSTNITNEMSVCVGLSTRTMPVNALVGTSRHSIGFYSGGRVLVGSQRRSFVSVENTFGIGNVVGVLVYIEKKISTNMANAIVRFSVDGKALRDRTGHVLVFSFPIPFEAELFPTLTLHSQGVQVFGRFSVPDVTGILQLEEFDLVTSKEQKDHTHGGIIDVWCLDGLRMNVFSSSQDGSFDDLKEKDKEENKTP